MIITNAYCKDSLVYCHLTCRGSTLQPRSFARTFSAPGIRTCARTERCTLNKRSLQLYIMLQRWEFIKEVRKQELDKESDQEKKESFFFLVFLFSWSLSWSSSCFLNFLSSFINSHLRYDEKKTTRVRDSWKDLIEQKWLVIELLRICKSIHTSVERCCVFRAFQSLFH